MLPELDDYDWNEAFGYAGEPDTCAGNNRKENGFTREDVAEIIFMRAGANDAETWLGIFRLKDGRFAYLSAGCDYTGWD